LKLVPRLPEIDAKIMDGEVMEVEATTETEIFHIVAILGQIKGQIMGGRAAILGHLGQAGLLLGQMGGQVGPTAGIVVAPIIDPVVGPQITDPVGPLTIDPVGLLIIDPVGLQIIDPVGPQVIDPVGPQIIDPVGPHPAIDPVGLIIDPV